MQAPDTVQGFEKHLDGWLDGLSSPAKQGLAKWPTKQRILLACLLASLITALVFLPNRFFDPDLLHVSLVLGVLGLWRFGWWFTHSIRAAIYGRLIWPGMRRRADRVWQSGWRPRRLHIQMTTYYEDPAITRRVIGSIIGQIRREGIPTTLWIGTGSSYDETIITEFARTHGADVDAQLVFLRQNQPGKRMAIGMVLRAMNRAGIQPDDLVIFMDGDAVYGSDVLEKTCSMFGADPNLQALTTNEEVLCYGPDWIQSWLSMRFAQRRLAMQSHALSKRVLTLTGRMSVFRAKHMIDERFIRTIEADHLDHWLWGRFRFLSGDDKSTWYHLLSRRSKMTYVPDACVYTIEQIEGSGTGRMVQNFRRWSGNMLRNGARAIALGPGVCRPFIWWCVVDQRIAMWTMLVSPIMALLSLFIEPAYILNCLIWIVASRTLLCLFLFRYAREPDMSWPFILYFNQIINAGVKVFMVFHLSKQKWSNRGNQSAGDGTSLVDRLQNACAKFQLVTTVTAFVTGLAIYIGLLDASIIWN
ncbi:chitooligosaccharide synthase NodC [Tritonibacter multivorans]|uniref:Chitooligosaccharide synthase NodC n=1 Tax=Tritonibacter multivorans TaxID=928856 RepID=A0A0P1GQA3_9RHOB|nr:glycosyltransferase [Tritonibacter multivorans]MDA7422526.1 glycosyltransferase [Tritonibacter multivorans]CUH76316.1 chitooligosaccharide synthase NodC [Tritonibacter multivorans]SFD40022.1 glycosyltransferase Alg8 [Tritonibacter multivorans]